MTATREFPALPGWTEYETAVQRYRDLVAERRQHADTLDALERGEAEAVKADDAAQAAAMLAGERTPAASTTRSGSGTWTPPGSGPGSWSPP